MYEITCIHTYDVYIIKLYIYMTILYNTVYSSTVQDFAGPSSLFQALSCYMFILLYTFVGIPFKSFEVGSEHVLYIPLFVFCLYLNTIQTDRGMPLPPLEDPSVASPPDHG